MCENTISKKYGWQIMEMEPKNPSLHADYSDP
jgi:hypothetical protein